MASISGARAASPTTIVFRAPHLEMTIPLGIPSSATGSSSTARTRLIFAADPVVTSTNQGNARKVICAPRDEIASALRSAMSPRVRSMCKILGRL